MLSGQALHMGLILQHNKVGVSIFVKVWSIRSGKGLRLFVWASFAQERTVLLFV